MTTPQLLDKLRGKGVSFTLLGDRFRWHADDGLSPHYVSTIRDHARQILNILQHEEDEATPDFGLDALPRGTCSQGHNQWALRQDNRGWNCRKCHPTLCR